MRSLCTSSKSNLSFCFVASFASSDSHVTNFRFPFVTSAYVNNGFTVSSTIMYILMKILQQIDVGIIILFSTSSAWSCSQ